MARKKNPEETIRNIKKTALELFKEKGYEQTTILDIVERMGVSRGSFYHHYKSKEEVLSALLAEKDEGYEKQLDVYRNSDLNGLEKIQHIAFHAGWEFEEQNEEDKEMEMLAHIWLDLLRDPKMMSEHLKELQGDKILWLQELIEEGIKDGSIEDNDPQLLAELILLLLNFWTMPAIYPEKNQNTFKKKVLMIKKVLDSLGCPLVDDKLLAIYEGYAQSYEARDYDF